MNGTRGGASRARILAPLSLAAGLGLFGLLLYRFASEIPFALERTRPMFASLYLALAAFVVAGHAGRWQLVARAVGAGLPLGRLIWARLAGEAIGALMPSAKVVGDPVRLALVHRDGIPGTAAGAGVALDRVLEMMSNILAATLFVTIFLIAHGSEGGGAAREILASLLVLFPALAFPLVLLWYGKRPLAPFYALVRKSQRPGVRQAVAMMQATEDRLQLFFREHAGTFFLGLLVSLLIEGVVVLEYWTLLAAFGVFLPLPTLLLALVFSGLSRAVPTPGGLGALEASQVAALAISGESAAAGFLVGLIMRMHETLLAVLGLGVCLARGLSFARLRLLTESKAAA